MELTKLLKNKDLRRPILTKGEEKSNELALNFEKLLGKADFANQTSSSPSTRRSRNNRKEDIVLSAELEHLLITETSKPNSNTKQSVQKNNHTSCTELSPYYRRDRRDYELHNDSDIADPDGLRALLQARFAAKKDKDFVQLTNLDLQLKREHGVRVSDYPRLWTRRTDASPASIRQKMRRRHARMKELFGLRGHPYLQIVKSPSTNHNESSSLALLAESYVHTSLSAWTRFQMEGKYEQADAIQLELSLCGIQIHDRLLLWTDDADVEFESLETIPDRVVDAPVYTKEKDDITFNVVTFRNRDCYKPRFGGRTMEEDMTRRDQRIQQLIRQRSEAHARGEATLSSLITLELESTYWVEMDDEQRTWRISKASSTVEESMSRQADQASEYTSSSFAALLFGEDLREYTSDTTYRQSQKSLRIDNQIHQQRINELVQERIHLREEGRYLEADAIRRELWHTYVSTRILGCDGCTCINTDYFCLHLSYTVSGLGKNVGVNDKLCQYSVGGAYDTDITDEMLDREKDIR